MSKQRYLISDTVLGIDLKDRLSEAQNHRCCFCGYRFEYSRHELNFKDVWPMIYRGVHLDISVGKKRYPTFEHIVPRIFGGTNDEENLAISCNDCNNKRGRSTSLTLDEISSDKEKLKNIGDFLKIIEDLLYDLATDKHLRKKTVSKLYNDATWMHEKLKKIIY